MDGFSYTNIFDTKGIEYLIIIGFLLLVIPFWIILNRPVKLQEDLKKAFTALSENILRIPRGLFFSPFHTWAFLENSGTVLTGADDLLLHITGDVSLENLKEQGERIRKGEPFVRLVGDGKSLEIKAPVSGEVTEVNTSVLKNVGVVNRDPYNKGWIYRIEPESWRKETGTFYFAEEAVSWMRREVDRVRSFVLDQAIPGMSVQPSVVLQEGGELADNPLAELPAAVWQSFQEKFLE